MHSEQYSRKHTKDSLFLYEARNELVHRIKNG